MLAWLATGPAQNAPNPREHASEGWMHFLGKRKRRLAHRLCTTIQVRGHHWVHGDCSYPLEFAKGKLAVGNWPHQLLQSTYASRPDVMYISPDRNNT
ncbi:hypothetical protein THICB2_340013 [Thiomonas sp. CB2]|nr:hypothetical protein THICB2_340013 [Thiomonas sp. CB2]